MPPTAIRRCVPGDEAALALVGQATFLESFAGTLPGPDILAHCAKQHAVEKYRAYLADPATSAWLATIEPGAAPVGYVLLTTPDLPLPDLTADDAEVKRVYVLARFQGAGLGGRLMEVARDHARALGRKRLLLGVYSRNDSALRFYAKLGYRRLGEREFQVGANRYHDFVLGLAL